MIGRKPKQTELTLEEQAVLAAFERIQQAMIDKDLDALYAGVTADKTFTHMSGKTQTKCCFIVPVLLQIPSFFQMRLREMNLVLIMYIIVIHSFITSACFFEAPPYDPDPHGGSRDPVQQ